MTTEKIGRRIRRNRKSESAESDEITIKRRGPKTRSQSRNRSKERKNSNSHLTDNEEIQTDDLEGFTFTKDSILDKLFIIFLKKRVHFLFGILFGLLILRIFKDTPVNGKWESEYIAQSFGWFKDDKDMSWFDLLGFEISKEQDYPGNSPELEGAVGKYPVVLIPGVVSTNLESWSSSRDKDECLNRYFRRKIWGDYSMTQAVFLDRECWMRSIMLDPYTGLDPQGIKVRAASGNNAADYFFPGYWVWSKIIHNFGLLGYDSNMLHLASYDWRLTPSNMEVRDGYFSKLKAHFELSKRLWGEKSLVVTHSMGGNVLHYFMKWVAVNGGGESWVNNHIHAIANIGTPYLGVPKTISSILSGETRDTAQMGYAGSFLLNKFFSKKERASIFQNWGSISSMLPKGGNKIWGNDSWAPDHPNEDFGEVNNRSFGIFVAFRSGLSHPVHIIKNHTADSLIEFIKKNSEPLFAKRLDKYFSLSFDSKSLSGNHSSDPRKWTNTLESTLPNAPNLTIYSLYGVGKPVERSYFYTYNVESNAINSPSRFTIDELMKQAKSYFYQRAKSESEHQEMARMAKLKEKRNHTNDVHNTSKPLKFFKNLKSKAILVNEDRNILELDGEITDTSSQLQAGVQDSDGDGSVPLISLGFMPYMGWRKSGDVVDGNVLSDGFGNMLNPAGVRIVVREYQHEPSPLVVDIRGGPNTGDHVDILGNYQMTLDILKIATGREYLLKDRILSDIPNISNRIATHNR